MLVAITKSHINENLFFDYLLSILVFNNKAFGNEIFDNGRFHIGYFILRDCRALEIYYKLLDYYDFDVDDLFIDEKHKILIQQYRLEKYGGKLTKVAN